MVKLFILFLIVLTSVTASSQKLLPYKGLGELLEVKNDRIITDTIVYHAVRVDQEGSILPWYSANPGESYNFVLQQVWRFWKNMEVDSNGQKYYMNHQIWKPDHDNKGIGGDQVMMALSSWNLYYNYTGDNSLIEDMKYMADHYLNHSLSSPDSKWPNLPYPYNTSVHSGVYDGDMILGKDYLQPDKAGSFGFELVELYKKTGNAKYLDAALKIATTLAEKVKPGDQDNSPWPFKVNAKTGETGVLVNKEVWYEGMDKDLKKLDPNAKKSSYTTFWTGTLNLFAELIKLRKGNAAKFQKAFDITINWLKKYPAKNNKWGPFFEDVPRWSDTQINAITYAMFLMQNPALDKNWKEAVKSIFTWVYKELGNKQYLKYGVRPIDEQTAYRVPGNSHSSRQASIELMYWEKTGDTTYVRNAIRQLHWATYMVDFDGKNFYPTNAIWMTDGYGDYVRHYLRAMAAAPQLAPENESHMLHSSSTIKNINYELSRISYSIFDDHSSQTFRLNKKPTAIKVNGTQLLQVTNANARGWTWQDLKTGGILKIKITSGNLVEIIR